MTKTSELLKQIRDEFINRLQRKTGWGRNELVAEYDEAVHTVIMKRLDD
jgi:hypothetical protein